MSDYEDLWFITPEDRIKHDNQFYLMNPVAGFLSGEQVKAFFLQSGLPPKVLGQIWQMSDINADGKMDKREFSIAMYLIKKALQGFDIPHTLPPGLLSNVPPGTAFNPVISSGMVGGIYGMVPQNHGILYSSATLPYPGDPRAFATMSKASVTSSTPGEWSVTPAQRLRYKLVFNRHDASHKGYLTGLEAKGILSQSGLTHSVLAQIWSLADIDTDGNLSPDEFCVALFLIDQAKAGFSIPPVLPPDLVPPSYRRIRRSSETVNVSLSSNIQASNPAASNKANIAGLTHTFQNMLGFESTVTNFPEQDSIKIITFEDKRKENFDKGQAELEKRRAMLRDMQLQESEERFAAERVEQEKREKLRHDQEHKKQLEQEKQHEKQRQIESEKEELRRKALEQKEAARRELERQRQSEWEKQRRDQLIADRNREQGVVDDLKQETGQQRLLFDSFEAKKMELLNRIDHTKVDINDMSSFIQSLKHSSLSKTIEIDVLKVELEEIEMKLVAAQQESLRLMKQINTPDSLADQGLQNLIRNHSAAKNGLDELKKKIDIIETTYKLKKVQITQLEEKVEQVKKMCITKQTIGPEAHQTEDLFSNFCTTQPQPDAEEKKSNAWDFNVFQSSNISLFDSSVTWSNAFSSNDNSSAFKEVKPANTSDAWASFGGETGQSSAWTADFNSFGSTTETTLDDPVQKYKVLYQFDAKNPDELSLSEGDVVIVYKKDQVRAEPGWMIGSLNGKEGCFPKAYVAEDDKCFDDAGSFKPFDNGLSFGVSNFDNPNNSFGTLRNDVTSSSNTSTENISSSAKSTQNTKKQVKVHALYPWQAKKENHLSFGKGDLIIVLNQQELWWYGELNGKVGWFPKSYVKVLGEPEAAYPSTPPEISADNCETNKPMLPQDPKTSVPLVPPSGLPERQKSTFDADHELQNTKHAALEEFIVVAMFTYSSNVPGDLTFNQGDVFPARKTDEEWWTGTLSGKTGIFPASYVQQMETLNKKKPERPSKPPTLNASKLQDKKPEIASVIAAYPATGPEQLTLQPGQLIHVRKKSPSGWWEGELQVKGQKRRIGWFPANYVKLLGASNRNTPEPQSQESTKQRDIKEKTEYVGLAIAMYSYEGQTEEDLSFQEGAIINLTENTNKDWWEGEFNGAVGIFPASYVALLPQKSNNSSINALS